MMKILKIDEINFLENEIFIPVFEKKIDKNILFEKLEQKDVKDILERADKFGFIGEKDQFFSYKNFHFLGLGNSDKITKHSYSASVENFFKNAIKDKHSDIYFLIETEYFAQTVEAFHFAKYTFDKYKSGKKEKKKTELSLVVSNENGVGLEKQLCQIESVFAGVDLSRDLINEPSSLMHPQTLLDEAEKIVKNSEGYLEIEVLDRKKCEELGMNAYLAVAQGSHREPFFIIVKTVSKAASKPLVLIGKSVTFDSGGLSIKPSSAMEDMKNDMAGGAIVLGVFEALSRLNKNNLKIEKNIIGILPACENMPASQAMRPGDIVSALNGKTIEILNTDADGRLTLADALSYSEKYLDPEVVIDIATLTGSIIAALGPDFAGIFSSDKELSRDIVEAGDESGEDIWPMPLHDNYMKNIKSNIADIRNTSTLKIGGGSITGSLFLKNFISDKIKWAHIDLGATVHDKLATGWGVRTVINYINKKI